MLKEMTLAEAVVEGAIDSHILTATNYPGAGATPIFNLFKKKIKCEESANEKIAYDISLGISYAGKRSVCVVKNVGMNVLSDSLINSCFSGVNGGLVVVTVDDMYVSYATNFQDSREFYNLTKTLFFEPSSPQEAYEMTKEAFILSEKFELPIIIRLEKKNTSLKGRVRLMLKGSYKPKPMKKNIKKWVLHPPFTINQTRILLEKQERIRGYAEKSKFNKLYSKKGDKATILFGLSYNEINPSDLCILKIGTLPVPRNKISKLLKNYKIIKIMEIGDPILEEEVSKIGNQKNIQGQLTKYVKPSFEKGFDKLNIICSDELMKKFYFALTKNSPDVIFGDIGVYTLGAFEPCNALDTALCMGASIGMAIGARLAGVQRVCAVIGDSTFIHAGIPALIEANEKKIDIKVFLIDNHCAVSTGGQKTFGDISSLIQSQNIPFLQKINIKDSSDKKIEDEIKNIMESKGLSVFIADFPKKISI